MALFIEEQLAVPDLLQALQKTTLGKLTPQQGKQFFAGGVEYLVQSVQVGSASLVQPTPVGDATVYYLDSAGVHADLIQGTSVQFTQPVTFQLVAGTISVGSLTFVLTLALRLDGGVASYGPPVVLAVPQTVLAVEGISLPPGADPAIVAGLQSLLGAAGQSVITPVSLGSLSVTNGGAALDATASRVALRMQVDWADQDYTDGQWRLFYSGANIADHLNVAGQKGNASVFLSGDFMAAIIQKAIEVGLAGSTDKFTLQGGIGSKWAPTAAGVAHVDAGFNGDVIMPSPAPDVHVDVSVGTDITLGPHNSVLTNGHVGWSANVLEEIVAVLVAGIVGGLTGAEFGGPLGAIIGWLVATVGTIIALVDINPPLSTPSCNQSGSDFNCSVTLQTGLDPITGKPVLRVNTAVGAPDGMIVLSQVDVSGLQIQSVTVRTFLRSKSFNFANGLRTLGTSVLNAQYIGSGP